MISSINIRNVTPSFSNSEKCCSTKNAEKYMFPTDVWKHIFDYCSFYKMFTSYDHWQIRNLCKDFKYALRPLKIHSYVFINIHFLIPILERC